MRVINDFVSGMGNDIPFIGLRGPDTVVVVLFLSFRLGSYLYYGTGHNVSFLTGSIGELEFRTFAENGVIFLVDKPLRK